MAICIRYHDYLAIRQAHKFALPARHSAIPHLVLSTWRYITFPSDALSTYNFVNAYVRTHNHRHQISW